jgi:hypothetical protein
MNGCLPSVGVGCLMVFVGPALAAAAATIYVRRRR